MTQDVVCLVECSMYALEENVYFAVVDWSVL